MTVVNRAGLRRVLKDGLAVPLTPLGYVPSRNRQSWMRDTGELRHVIALSKHREHFTVQWGIVCPELVEVMWAMPYKPFEVAQSIVTDTASAIRHPARANFFRAELLETDSGAAEVAAGLSADVKIITDWMTPMLTRRALREYLLLCNQDETERRAFVVPGSLRLTLLTAAGLATLDGDPSACELLAQAESVAGAISGEITLGRFARMRALAANLCG